MSAGISARTRAILALRLVPGVGPRTLAAILERYPDPGLLLTQPPVEWGDIPHVSREVLGRIAEAARSDALQNELSLLARHQVRPLVVGDGHYPESLAVLEGMPPLLYWAGQCSPEDRRAVAIVGSRDPTPYGRRVAQKLAFGLARAGITVVSGLARGIDGVAHEAALEAGGRTLAVLANGLAGIYPPEHADLAVRICQSGGLISEHPMDQKPQAGLFPSRNRLISALSLAVVVVEAQAKSGTLHTATHAAEQGRPLLAVPGPIDSPLSQGCNTLLREGAVVCRGVEDVLEAIGEHAATPMPAQMAPTSRQSSPVVENPPSPPPAPKRAEPARQPSGLSGPGLEIWKSLENGPVHLEVIAEKLGLTPGSLAQALFPLELGRHVRRLPGGRLERS